MVTQTATSKTWRCPKCRRKFTINREGDDWSITIEGFTGPGLGVVAAMLGIDDVADVIAGYHQAAPPIDLSPECVAPPVQTIPCVYCVSEEIIVVSERATAKTWRCPKCRRKFTLEREGEDWRLLTDTGLLGSGLREVGALLGIDDVADVIAGYERAALPSGKETLREPEDEDDPLEKELQAGLAGRCSLPDAGQDNTPRGGVHVLADSITDAREFIRCIEEHLSALAELLGTSRDRLDGSLSSAAEIDAAIERDRESWLRGEKFRGLVAYSGEAIRARVSGHWVAKYNNRDHWWEPFIRDDRGRFFNPWLDLYKGILEEEAGCFGTVMSSQIPDY